MGTIPKKWDKVYVGPGRNYTGGSAKIEKVIHDKETDAYMVEVCIEGGILDQLNWNALCGVQKIFKVTYDGKTAKPIGKVQIKKRGEKELTDVKMKKGPKKIEFPIDVVNPEAEVAAETDFVNAIEEEENAVRVKIEDETILDAEPYEDTR